ncbi:tetratricopeptide repeat protein [Roseivirga sp.]|uniref:tetratricopeptide repeat protein n=1 Tax=Roseivirga sp. TaxID=1964215 RepID=UPI002B26A8FF|nr:tetratricopeptide repeat protein [Roseivirga sp.]
MSEMIEKWIKEGVKHCENAKFEEGVKCFNKALEKEPNHTTGLHNRARALSRIGQLEAALADFEKLTQLFPCHASFIGDYAVALHLNDKNDLALVHFEKALQLEPTNPYRYSSRAFFKDRTGDLEGAIADYEKAVEMDPEDAIALNNKGLVEEKLGYKDKAKQSFDRSNNLVGYDPTKTNPLPKTENKAPKFTSTKPTNRWEVVKSVFTKEGFKDFAKFTKGLVNGKKG